MSKIHDERFRLEIIDIDDVRSAAIERGWKDGDSYFDYAEPSDHATYVVFKTLDEAAASGRLFLKTGKACFGCVIIDQQVYEAPTGWETQDTYEIAMDGEMIKVGS